MNQTGHPHNIDMSGAFRKQLTWLHTWTGLTLGLVIVMLAVTGAGLALRPQLERIVDRDLLRVPTCAAPLPLDELAAVARAARPADILHSIEVTLDTQAPVAVRFENRDYVYLDPCSGQILGIRNQYAGFFGTLDWLHRFLFMDKPIGKLLAGWSTAAYLVLLIVGGVVLWWPQSRAALKSAIRFNGKLPGIARTLSLHKIVGLYTSLVLLGIAVTALPISFQPIKNLLYSATGYVEPAAPRSAVAGTDELVSMSQIWETTRNMVPGLTWVTLNYPQAADDAVRIEILETDAPHVNAKSYLYLDAYTGKALLLLRYPTDIGLGRRIYLYSIALHAALVGGLPYQLLLLVVVLAIPVQVYSGISPYLRRKLRRPARTTMVLKVVGKTAEAADICSFELADPKGKALPPFSAGSHIDVHLPNGLIRQYSLCNDAGEMHRYLIGVLREPDSRGGSVYLHDEVTVGDRLEVSLPKNHFPLMHSARHSLLIAGGIGITPILCMAERLANSGADFNMRYCARSREHAAFVDRIQRSAFAGRVHFHFSDRGERLDIAALLAQCGTETHLYVCGPNRFMDAVLEAARTQGWTEERVHREYFAAAEHDSAQDSAFDVRIASSGRVFHIPKDRTVVSVLAEHGIDIPVSCSQGVCGTCLTHVIEGEVAHHDMILSSEERAKNEQFTPCCSRSVGPMLVLDL